MEKDQSGPVAQEAARSPHSTANTEEREGPARVPCGFGTCSGCPFACLWVPCRLQWLQAPLSPIPRRFILDDSALYLSDKCEVETLDLRRGGQGLDQVSSPLSSQCPPHGRVLGTHTRARTKGLHPDKPRVSPLVAGQGLGEEAIGMSPVLCFRLCLCLGC